MLFLLCTHFFSLPLGAQSLPCASPSPGMVAWWRAEGDANDAVNGNSGALFNGATFAPGEVGQAFAFNGTNSYIEVPDSPVLRLTNELTIEFWVKRLQLDPPSFPYADYIVEKGGDWTGGVQNYAVALHNPQYNYCLHFVFAGGWRGGGSVADTNWHHCAVVARNGDADPTLYIDGVPQPIVYREGASAINLYNSTRPLHIGALLDPATGWFYYSKTLVDELAFYNRALGSNEIQAIYHAGGAGKCVPVCVPPPSGLISWWPGQGNSRDAGGGNNHGSLVGNTSYGPGEVGQGFVLDGNADAVPVGAATNLQMQDFTIEAWVKRASTSIASFNSGGGEIFGFGSGGYCLGMNDDGSLYLTKVDIDNVTLSPGITDTDLHHVTVTKSGTTVVFYIDGVAYPVPAYSTTYVFSTPAAIGARGDSLANSFFGSIDEVSVYNRPLSAAEVLAIYKAGAAGKCRAVIGPSISSQPVSKNAFVGDTVSFNVGATGDSPLTFQWRFNDVALSGMTGSSLTFASVDPTNAGVYSVLVTNSGGSILSSNATLTVNPRPPCTPAPSGLVSWWQGRGNAADSVGGNNGTLIGNAALGPGRVGQGFVFDGSSDAVRVGPAANLQFQDFTIEAWIKRASISIASFDFSGGEIFGFGSGGYCLGMNDNGSLYLTKVDIDNVTLSPGITDTDFHHVAVTKSGTTVVFYIDGVAYSVPAYNTSYVFSTPAAIGARGDTLANSFFGSIDEVSVYNRPLSASEIQAIYNADGSGKCRIPIAPFISLQPTNRTVYAGNIATFTVVAGGDAPLGYQWLFGDSPLTDKTNATLALIAVQPTNAGNYSVIVSNSVGSVTSSIAILTVKPLPPCTPIPDGLVSWWRGEGDLTDSWDSNNGVQPSGSAIVLFSSGKVGRAFNFLSSYVLVADAPSLRVTNALTIEAWVNPSSLTGTRTILAKFDTPASLIQTNSSYWLGLTNNGRLFFSVSATGSARTNVLLLASQPLPLSQWSFVVASYDGVALRLYTNGTLAAQLAYSSGIFPGSSSLAIGAIPSSTLIYPFSGLVDEVSLYHRALSDSEILSIYNSDLVGKCSGPPVIATQPQSQAIPLGEDVLFSVSVFGSKPLKYQWRFNGTNLLGATNVTLLLEKVRTNQAGDYSVRVSNVYGSVISSDAALTLLPASSCVAAPAGIISWWPADNFGNDVIGTNNAVPGPVFPVQGFLRYATGKVGQAFSFVATSAPATVSNSATLNFGSNADFTIEGWVKAFQPATNIIYLPPIPRQTSQVYIVQKLLSTRFGSPGAGYSLLLNEGHLACQLVSGSPLGASNTFTSTGPDVRDGMFHHLALTLHRDSANGGNLYVDGQSVLTFDPRPERGSLSNSTALVIGDITPNGRVIVPSPTELIDELAIYNRELSAAEILAIRQAGAAGKCPQPPDILVQPTNQIVNIGNSVSFKVVASGIPPLSYQWHKNGTNVAGFSSTYTILAVGMSDAADYTVTVTNLHGAVTSLVATLTVNRPPTASDMTAATKQNQPVSIATAKLVLYASDPDGDPLTVRSVSATSTNGGGVVLGTTAVTYTPLNNFIGADRFTYTVNDGRGGSASAFVLLQVRPADQVSGNMLPPVVISGGFRVSFVGIPGRAYTLQRAETPSGPWTTLSTITVGPDGIGTFDDTNAPPTSAYYRTVYP